MKARSTTSRIAWFALLAIVWHALMPLAHAASTQQGLLASICTTGAPGLELIKLPAGGQDDSATHKLLQQCPLCAAGAHFAIVDGHDHTFSPNERFVHVQSPAGFLFAARTPAWLHFSPRAPPQQA
ncbi:DUF2946 family protein [Uliginosibacterium sp. H3]|uniref:DUF2946 family protein n=1 Tax=Uliginosibacterium silvisoli TaxID=3114758 RepID=A0ABU6K5I6_9RHOO|nr:DUF2946 family protein [Uliginosibacterium sp. H3]